MYVRRCAYGHFSPVLCCEGFPHCEGFLSPASLTQRDESQRFKVKYRFLVSAGTLLLIFTLYSVRRVGHFHVVRLEAVLSGLHVTAGPSEIRRRGATVLLAKLGGATGPYLAPLHDIPLAKRPRRPRAY